VTLVLILGLLMNAVALPLAARRVWFLYRVISSGQPAPDRIEGVTGRMGAALKRQVVEVFGQKKLLKWTVPGAAHFFVFWAFLILATVYLEAYGSLLKLLFTGGDGALDWAIPIVGDWAILGFVQDFIAMMAFLGILTFVYIRVKQAPDHLGRRSRFFGSHLSGAWITLFMIFNVIWTMFLFRGASAALGNLPYQNGAFISIGLGKVLDGLAHGPLEALEGVGLLLHIGVMLVFLIFVLNSKHLHIFVAPLNVLFGRQPVALGAAKPMMSDGKPLTLDDLEDLDEDAKLGVGAAEDFSWKGILDFSTCTECGRCQDQCPAWNTEKPLSPKLMIMALRDHTMAKAPYLLAAEDKREKLLEGNEKLAKEVERPLVGDTGDDWFYMPENGGGAIDPDVLWSCVTCGACVEQCPVDIEHVDHIVDMRRYQVLVESNFPSELNGLFKGLENKGNPWNMSPTARMDWAKDLPFDVKVVGEDVKDLDEVDWLFWVGSAGAYEDRAKKTTRAVAELLDMAGVSFAVLGNGETCTGDSARRAGNEFVFQGLAAQNIETFTQYKVKKVVSTCAHCFNTLKNEYSQLGIELEVVHHTQLLNRLVREKRLAPVASNGGGDKRSITYHDPCYIGRHNGVYSPPRELLSVIPDAELTEMPRNSERSFCCGAGGARMWMEETIGSRINETRTKEAVETGADQIAVGCPFCRVMLSDGLTAAQSKGEAREEVEVLDIAQMLLASVKGESKPSSKKAAATAAESGGDTATATIERTESRSAEADTDDEASKAEPEAGDTTQTDETVIDTEDVGPAAKASGGSSLFDLGYDSDDAEKKPEPAEDKAADEKEKDSGGSLFDLGGDDDSTAESAEPEAREEPQAEQPAVSIPANEVPEGGSLFDIEAPAEEAAPAASDEDTPQDEDTAADSTTDGETDRSEDDADTDVEPEAESEVEQEPEARSAPGESSSTATPANEIPEGGSLFDIETPAAEAAPAVSDEDTEDSSPADPDTSDDADAPVTSLRDIKAKYADGTASSTVSDDEPAETSADDAEDSAGVEAEAPEPEPKDEADSEESEPDEDAGEQEDTEEKKRKPASSGDTHQPRTDAEIGEGGSLFDL
jgi:Fe-S oxidoreductase